MNRKYEKTVFLVFALLSFGLAYALSDAAFLCVLYGLSNVRTQQLHLLGTPNGQAWRVSNGDEIPPDLHPLHFGIAALLWLVLALVGFALLRRVLAGQHGAIANRGGSNATLLPLHPEAMERRIWAGTAHYLRRRAMGLVLCWILSVVGLCVLAQWIGRLSLALILGMTIGFLGYYIRLRQRQFMVLMRTTACPECGLIPMRFDTGAGERGVHRLLVCDRCRVEWDFGPL